METFCQGAAEGEGGPVDNVLSGRAVFSVLQQYQQPSLRSAS
jgi:hypothetical protein